jgi:site-specific DNA recombinase
MIQVMTMTFEVVIYARCSTDENKQDVDKQIKELERYAQANGWNVRRILQEYVSAFKNTDRTQFNSLMNDLRLKKYNLLLVYDLSRFSRQEPYMANQDLNRIVHVYGCRFVSLNDNIDSDNELQWNVMRNIMVWINHNYSKNLSDSIKSGIQNKKDKGLYKGGRPSIYNKISKFEILQAYNETKSFRKASKKIWLDKQIRVSYLSIKRVVDSNQDLLL